MAERERDSESDKRPFESRFLLSGAKPSLFCVPADSASSIFTCLHCLFDDADDE